MDRVLHWPSPTLVWLLSPVSTGFSKLSERNQTRWLVLFLLVAGLTPHFAIPLSSPPVLVFDETSYADQALAYSGHRRLPFDIHPPHGKLLIGAIASLGNPPADLLDPPEEEGAPAKPIPGNYLFWLRLGPALAGSFFPLLFFFLLLELGASRGTAVVGGLLMAFETAILLHTRLVATEAFLLDGIFGSVWAFLISRRKSGWKALEWASGAGLALAVAVGSKFTGLLGMGIIGLVTLRDFIFRGPRSSFALLPKVAATFVAFLAVYCAGWFIHFSLLVNAGQGDGMFLLTHHFWSDLLTVHSKMLTFNQNFDFRTSDSMEWWTWFWLHPTMGFWFGRPAQGVVMVPNSLIWWSAAYLVLRALISLTVNAFRAIRNHRWDARLNGPVALLAISYLASYLVFSLVQRGLYTYHYFPSLVLSVAAGLLWAQESGWFLVRGKPSRLAHRLVALSGLFVVLYSPLIYGFCVDHDYWDAMFYFSPFFW